MNEIGRRRAERVLQQLRDNPETHDQRVYFRPTTLQGINFVHLDVEGENVHTWDCGTARCFAGQLDINLGAEPAIRLHRLDFDNPSGEKVAYHGRLYPADIFAMAALDIDHSQADRLFAGSNTVEQMARMVEEMAASDGNHEWRDCVEPYHHSCRDARDAWDAIQTYDPETV